jgi:hypothetical protein
LARTSSSLAMEMGCLNRFFFLLHMKVFSLQTSENRTSKLAL